MGVLKLNNPLGVSQDDVMQYLDLLVRYAKTVYDMGIEITPDNVVVHLRVFEELERFKWSFERETISFEQAFSPQLFEELGYAVWIEAPYNRTKDTNPFGNYYVGKIIGTQHFVCGVTSHLTTTKGFEGFEGIEVFQNTLGKEKPIESVVQNRTNSIYYFDF